MQKQHAVLLDLNGTLNDKGGYCHAHELEVALWAIKAVRLFNKHGLPIVVITNQSGMADGKFSHGEWSENLERILLSLEQHEAFIGAIYFCPHSKEDNCVCKKPKSAMLVRAAEFLHVQPQDCFMIGDTGYSDMQAGHSAG